MKKCICIFTVLLLYSLYLFADDNPNYKNGNGTIIFKKIDNNIIEILRKCEVIVKIGDLARQEERIMYDDYKNKKAIGLLQDNDNIKVLQVYTLEDNNKQKDKWGNARGELWYKITRNNEIAWICKSQDYLGTYTDPYYNNRYQITGMIQSSGKNWTVRTMDQTLSVWENLNIRDNPGTTGNKIIYIIKPNITDPVQTNVEVIAMTEEVEEIDGKKDHWIKVKYKNYTGWIFGGYATAERGGPKYYIPEGTVDFDLSWY